MGKTPLKRIKFLTKKFNIFNESELDLLTKNGKIDLMETLLVDTEDGDIQTLAIYSWNPRKLRNEGIKTPNNVRISKTIFDDIIDSDPTDHKEYVQWMLTTFVRLIKESEFDRAIRFVKEDLWSAFEYLKIFNSHKYKPNFKKLCKYNLAFKNITDPSDINQYRDLSQLFDAVDPYIERNESELERNIRMMVRLKKGLIPYEDRDVIVFNPLTIEASRLFSNFTNWCTTLSKGTFISHTSKYKTPTGQKSKLYIVIFKSFLLGDSEAIYQLHFETNQFMDRKDVRIKDLSILIKDNVGLGDYFYDLLFKYGKIKGSNSNLYIKPLIKFGFEGVEFKILDDSVSKITMTNINVGDLPDMSRFRDTKLLYLFKCNLNKLHPSIGDMSNLEILSLSDNKLKELPKTIGKLKKLKVLNIKNNEIMGLPETIKELGVANGGSLEYISADKKIENIIMGLLPNVRVNNF